MSIAATAAGFDYLVIFLDINDTGKSLTAQVALARLPRLNFDCFRMDVFAAYFDVELHAFFSLV
jgi:hypothetical protein